MLCVYIKLINFIFILITAIHQYDLRNLKIGCDKLMSTKDCFINAVTTPINHTDKPEHIFKVEINKVEYHVTFTASFMFLI